MRSGGNVRLFAATRTPCLTLRRCASRLCTDGAASQLYEQLRPAALQSRGQGPPPVRAWHLCTWRMYRGITACTNGLLQSSATGGQPSASGAPRHRRQEGLASGAAGGWPVLGWTGCWAAGEGVRRGGG